MKTTRPSLSRTWAPAKARIYHNKRPNVKEPALLTPRPRRQVRVVGSGDGAVYIFVPDRPIYLDSLGQGTAVFAASAEYGFFGLFSLFLFFFPPSGNRLYID